MKCICIHFGLCSCLSLLIAVSPAQKEKTGKTRQGIATAALVPRTNTSWKPVGAPWPFTA